MYQTLLEIAAVFISIFLIYIYKKSKNLKPKEKNLTFTYIVKLLILYFNY